MYFAQTKAQKGLEEFSMTKKIIPFGTRITVQRRKVGEKLGSGILIAPAQTADNPTEIATVIDVAHDFIDDWLFQNADKIIAQFQKGVLEGDSGAYASLQSFKDYLRLKSIKVGDTVFISRYMQTDILIGETNETITLMDINDVRGLVIES